VSRISLFQQNWCLSFVKMPIRVVIVGNDLEMLDPLASVLGESGYQCVGTYQTGDEVLRHLRRDLPDLALVSSNLDGMTSSECCIRIRSQLPECRVILLAVYDDRWLVSQARGIGARACVVRRSEPEGVLEAIGASSNRPLGPAQLVRPALSASSNSHQVTPTLSGREMDVLRLVAKGYANKEIASALQLSLETVRSYLKSVYDKLQVKSRTEAAVKFLSMLRA
jgi:DNA-binding NarL/FixJ family response regulator